MQFQEEKLILNPFKFESNSAIDESKDDNIDDSSVLTMSHKLHKDHYKVRILF